MQFQETFLNRKASQPVTMRLPMKCFLDFEPGGSICHIFSTMYHQNADQQWATFDFDVNNTALKDSYIQMSKEVFEKLVEHKCFRLPTLYIRHDISDDLRKQISNILKNHQCDVTDNQNEATHIIYPEIDLLPEDYARPSFKRGKFVMLHWYYLPESYDSWIEDTFNLPVNNPTYIFENIILWYS